MTNIPAIPLAQIKQLWDASQKWEALQQAWVWRPDFLADGHVGNLCKIGVAGLHELLLGAGQEVVRAARERRSNAQATDWLRNCLEATAFNPAHLLYFHKEDSSWNCKYRLLMIRTHLACIHYLLTVPPSSIRGTEDEVFQNLVPNLNAFAQTELGKDAEPLRPMVSAGFLRDLLLLLREQPERPAEGMPVTPSVLVVDKGISESVQETGLVYNLVLELIADKTGTQEPSGGSEVYPHPSMADIPLSPDFLGSIRHACREAQRMLSEGQPFAIRWQLNPRDSHKRGPLSGTSAGAAFGLGILQLLAKRQL